MCVYVCVIGLSKERVCACMCMCEGRTSLYVFVCMYMHIRMKDATEAARLFEKAAKCGNGSLSPSHSRPRYSVSLYIVVVVYQNSRRLHNDGILKHTHKAVLRGASA